MISRRRPSSISPSAARNDGSGRPSEQVNSGRYASKWFAVLALLTIVLVSCDHSVAIPTPVVQSTRAGATSTPARPLTPTGTASPSTSSTSTPQRASGVPSTAASRTGASAPTPTSIAGTASSITKPQPLSRTAPADPQPQFPIRAAFYYQWFPEGWHQNGPGIFTRYQPSLGVYDSGNAATIRSHIESMQYGKIQAVIVSWWGQHAKSEQTRVPALMNAASTVDPALRVALYYEKEGTANPSVKELKGDLKYMKERYAGRSNYLRVNGRPVLYVYNADDADCSVAKRWKAANADLNFYVVLKVVPGWQNCASQPSGWHQYAPSSRESRVASAQDTSGSFTISPGFWHAKTTVITDAEHRFLARNLTSWKKAIRDMISSGENWQLITSFNEWGEGTSVESAQQWASPSGQGSYLDALHNDGN